MIKPLLAAFVLAMTALASPALAARIEEAGYVRIGGIDQWVSLRGDDAKKPILLVVHGGPAEAQSPFVSLYGAYEKAFVVVLWDQRGSGKTFARNGEATPDMTLERIVADGLEVAEHARRKLGRRKVVLMGHSWGSQVALNMARKRPELFTAYVGTGQFVSWPATVEGQRDFALGLAQAKGDEAAVTQLKAMGPADFADMSGYGRIRPWISQGMAASDLVYLDRQRTLNAAAGGPAASDVADWRKGGAFSLPKLIPFILTGDVRKLGADWPIPMFVIQGAEDRTTPTPIGKAWFATLKAPSSRFTTIDGGHFAYMSNAGGFVAALSADLALAR